MVIDDDDRASWRRVTVRLREEHLDRAIEAVEAVESDKRNTCCFVAQGCKGVIPDFYECGYSCALDKAGRLETGWECEEASLMNGLVTAFDEKRYHDLYRILESYGGEIELNFRKSGS